MNDVCVSLWLCSLSVSLCGAEIPLYTHSDWTSKVLLQHLDDDLTEAEGDSLDASGVNLFKTIDCFI